MRALSSEPETTPLGTALAMVGDRWSLAIVDVLRAGPRRFGEIQEALREVSPNILSARLKQLTADRIVIAQPYSDRPARFTYELTSLGRGLLPAAELLEHWGVVAAGGQLPDIDPAMDDPGIGDTHYA